jgi:hypothetical protein
MHSSQNTERRYHNERGKCHRMMISQMYSEEILVLCVDFSKDGFHEN